MYHEYWPHHCPQCSCPLLDFILYSYYIYQTNNITNNIPWMVICFSLLSSVFLSAPKFYFIVAIIFIKLITYLG